MCAYINKIGHNRAIRPYHPSNSKLFYSILLAFVPYPAPDRLSMIGGGGGWGVIILLVPLDKADTDKSMRTACYNER